MRCLFHELAHNNDLFHIVNLALQLWVVVAGVGVINHLEKSNWMILPCLSITDEAVLFLILRVQALRFFIAGNM